MYRVSYFVQPRASVAVSEPTPHGTLSDDDVEKAKEVAAAVAADFKMKPIWNIGVIGHLTPEEPEASIAYYIPKEAGPGWDEEGVSIQVILRDDRTRLEYFICDARHGSETKFSHALIKALQEKLEATFGRDRISSPRVWRLTESRIMSNREEAKE